MLYLPLELDEDPADPQVLFGADGEGRTVIIAFSALDRLLAAGEHDQAWVVIPTEEVVAVVTRGEASRIVLDPAWIPRAAVGGHDGRR